MKKVENHVTPKDELFRVEMQIAKRADELTRLLGTDPSAALECWRRAEREVWQDADSMHQSARS